MPPVMPSPKVNHSHFPTIPTPQLLKEIVGKSKIQTAKKMLFPLFTDHCSVLLLRVSLHCLGGDDCGGPGEVTPRGRGRWVHRTQQGHGACQTKRHYWWFAEMLCRQRGCFAEVGPCASRLGQEPALLDRSLLLHPELLNYVSYCAWRTWKPPEGMAVWYIAQKHQKLGV